MPPLVPRKRLRSDSSEPEQPPKRPTRKNTAPRRVRESVFQTLDSPPKLSRTTLQTKALLEQEDDSSDSDDADLSEDDFEDVINTGSSKNAQGKQKAQDAESSGDEEWEDALGAPTSFNDEPEPVISGDVNITLSSHPASSAFSAAATGKKGPSKIQRHIRVMTHCMHVQALMFHNLVRNGWIQDREVQRILVSKVRPGCWSEIERYWRDAGIQDGPGRVVKGGRQNNDSSGKVNGQWRETGEKGVKEFTASKGKNAAKAGSSKGETTRSPQGPRNQREWGAASDRLERNVPNLSAGDPLLRLLQYLAAYWKSVFKITALSLRKRGYLSPSALEAELAGWREDPTNANNFGERIENLEEFRQLAQRCEGSRDVGQQLFTALLRGLGIEARMVASLQPVGFGWSQAEEGKERNLEKPKAHAPPPPREAVKSHASPPSQLSRRGQSVNGTKVDPINLSDNDSSDLSSALSSSNSEFRSVSPKKKSKNRNSGDELPFPTYWTEAISHLTLTPISVSPLPRPLIAMPSAPDALQGFYCRGAAADKAKQVFAYIIAFSLDGTAKDVTTRYLPKQQWPGKTKGFRLPVEKVPVYNKRGKVTKWQEWDWFKSVMRPYARSIDQRQPWDEVEDEGDLVPKQPAKPKTMDEEGGKETLQGYKDSAEYVLERHLRREEALRPGAKIVRYFKTGKGDKEKNEPVYYRKDIVACKTVESWHKEGRAVKEGEQPLKYVPMRAVTVTRKREIEERQREEGKKVMQGLYAQDQTDWIIPEPIEDGRIPRNAFGNIDVYVPTMVPKGAVHIPLKGTGRICKKLGVDYAEACTGFEFGKQRAVPVLTGVVVAAENEDLVKDAWEAEEAEKARKEEAKRETLALTTWKRFLTGLRILERMRREYGDEAELPKAEILDAPSSKKSEWDAFQSHEGNFEGGFIREDGPPDSTPPGKDQHAGHDLGAFVRDDEPFDGDHQARVNSHGFQEANVLTIDHGEADAPSKMNSPGGSSHQTPISLHAAHQQAPERLADGQDSGGERHEESEPAKTPRGHNPKRASLAPSSARARSLRRSSRIKEDDSKRVTSPYFAPSSETDVDGMSEGSPRRSADRSRGKVKR